MKFSVSFRSYSHIRYSVWCGGSGTSGSLRFKVLKCFHKGEGNVTQHFSGSELICHMNNWQQNAHLNICYRYFNVVLCTLKLLFISALYDSISVCPYIQNKWEIIDKLIWTFVGVFCLNVLRKAHDVQYLCLVVI